MIPPIEETFAGNSWRVVEVDAIVGKRFAVVGTAPTTFGAEVEICRVQYRPHALAIAALPEMAAALSQIRTVGLGEGATVLEHRCGLCADEAIAKAEERRA